MRPLNFHSPRVQKPGYIDVDALQAETSLEDAAAKCGEQFDGKRSGAEVRIDCPFGCPGDHVGRREISISTENPQKVFYCHAYQCQLRGNLLTLMHGWMTGQRPAGDKLKGAEFNQVKQVLAACARPGPNAPDAPTAPPQPASERREAPAPAPSVPLEDSVDEAVRALATIDEKFVTDVAAMSPAAASYVRRHPALSSESMKKWRVGYLPMDGGGDKRGWSLRGHIIYPVLSEDGKVLAWIGRDPSYEEKGVLSASVGESLGRPGNNTSVAVRPMGETDRCAGQAIRRRSCWKRCGGGSIAGGGRGTGTSVECRMNCGGRRPRSRGLTASRRQPLD